MFASLLPKSAPFFEMLLEQNSHLRHMSRLLLAMLEDLSKMDEAHKEIALIEEEADKLHVRIIRDLSQTFITPIDREDILRINQEQEEALDGLHTLSTRLHIFEFPTMRFPAVQLVRTICSMLELTGEMLDGLTRRHAAGRGTGRAHGRPAGDHPRPAHEHHEVEPGLRPHQHASGKRQ